MKIKKKLLKIFTVASIITIIGLLMDGDAKEPSMAMRFVEFFAMLATTFILFSIIYYISTFTFKKIKNLSA